MKRFLRQRLPAAGLSLHLTLGLLAGQCTLAFAADKAVGNTVDTAGFKLSSTAFKEGDDIPKNYTADGKDVSPPLSWEGIPAKAQSLALICDDPDAAPPEPWVHWVIYGLPANAAGGLSEAVVQGGNVKDLKGAMQGKNSWGKIGYRGPKPPPGKVHLYHFRLFALDADLKLKPGLTKTQLLAAMRGHVVAMTELVGKFSHRP